MTSNMRIVAGGYRDNLVLLDFEPSSAKLKVISESPVPNGPSWVEACPRSSKVLYSLSEDEENGKAISVELKGDKYELVTERKTDAAPCHIHYMNDGSGIIVANYAAGTVVFFPIDDQGHLVTKSESAPLKFPFAYEGKKGPNEGRQDQPHAHCVGESPDGKLYAVDLGSDRIWTIEREGDSGLKVSGYLQCPPGSGPRHIVISPNGKHLYALTELTNDLFLFTLDGSSTHPSPDFTLNIVPDTVPKNLRQFMYSAELVSNPAHPNILYASNRNELHLNEEQADKSQSNTQKGDAICIITLSEDGSKVVSSKHVRTECDYIRGVQVSKDGKYVAIAGQKAGGVEIWQVGSKGDDWKLAAKEESIKGITDFVWL